MSSKVLCYGGLCIDNIIHVPYMPTPGIATSPTHQKLQLGGGATQTALWLAKWSVSVALTGNAIGYDEYGQQILGELRKYDSLDSSQIVQSADAETPYTRAIIPPNGDRYLYEFYDKSPMCPAGQVDFTDVDIVTVNFYYNNPERESVKVAETAYKQGITVIASDILDEDNPFFPVSDILINSRAVMHKKLPNINHLQYISDLQQQHGGVIIMTDGECPVYAVDRNGSPFQVEIPHVDVLDTTGAGDAFRAGIVYGVIHDWALTESAKLAAAAGMLQVQRDASIEQPSALDKALALAKSLITTT